MAVRVLCDDAGLKNNAPAQYLMPSIRHTSHGVSALGGARSEKAIDRLGVVGGDCLGYSNHKKGELSTHRICFFFTRV